MSEKKISTKNELANHWNYTSQYWPRTQTREAFTAKESIIAFWKSNYRLEYPQLRDFLRENLLFITITFHPSRVCACNPRGFPFKPRIPVMQATGLLYHRIMKEMVSKNNLGRKRHLQPPMHTWIDFENSRIVPTMDLYTARNPHIHGLAICHPGQAAVFKSYLECEAFTRVHVPEADGIQARFYDRQQLSLYKLADYCSKGYSKLLLGPDDNRKIEMRQVFPK